MKKKLTAAIMVMTMLITMIPTSFGAEFVFYEGLKLNTETGEIVNCDRNIKGEVEIPEEIEGNKVIAIGKGAFMGCDLIESVFIPGSVKYIGTDAFSGMRKLSNVTISEGVESIGDGAFFQCFLIKSIDIPPTVTYIGKRAFRGCNYTESVTVPSSVKSIGDEAFYDCRSLSRINIEDGVVSIGKGAFQYNDIEEITLPSTITAISDKMFAECRIKQITIPQSVTSIGNSAFEDCSRFKSITIPDSVRSIGHSAFSGCKTLKSIDIPNSVTSIGAHAFSGCASLTDAVIPEGVNEIGSGTFSGCESLESISIPKNVYLISDSAFEKCSALKNIRIADENSCYTASENVIFSKDKRVLVRFTEGKNESSYSVPDEVETIGEGAFSYCGNLKNVILPEGLKNIKFLAFRECCSLEGLDIPSTVTDIENSAFYQCTSLKNISVPEGITEIKSDLFDRCEALESVKLPSTLELISYSAFEKCVSLKEITVPFGVTKIYSKAFNDCSALENITLPDSVREIASDAFSGTSIYESEWEDGILYIDNCLIKADKSAVKGDYKIKEGTAAIAQAAFRGCELLESITIPGGVTMIPNYAFENCRSLNNLTLSEGLTDIGYFAFSNCKGLQKITVPQSVASVGTRAFYGCDKLSEIVLPDSVEHIGGYAFDDTIVYKNERNWKDGVLYIGNHLIKAKKESLSGNYKIKQGTVSIAEDAFTGCALLETVTMPDTLRSIEDEAFRDCHSLKELNLPESLTYIGGSAFGFCEKLKNIIIPKSVQNIGRSGDAFILCDVLESIDVDAENENYASDNGVLYDKEKTLLLYYPDGKIDESYSVPEGVSQIWGFKINNYLKKLSLPDSIAYLDEHAFIGLHEITDIYFAGTEVQWQRLTPIDCLYAASDVQIHYEQAGISEEKAEEKSDEITVFYNGEQIEFDQSPVIENDRTLVPLRAIFETLGAAVEWDGETGTVTAQKAGIYIKLTIDDDRAYKNGEEITLDAPARLINERTLVPVRFIADCFGVKTNWTNKNRRVDLTE